MEVLTFVLVFCTVSGFSSVLNLRPILTEVHGLNRDDQSDTKAGKQLRDVSKSAEVKETLESTEAERFTPEMNVIGESGEKTRTVEERKGEDGLMSKMRNAREIQERNEEYLKSGEETLIPETSETDEKKELVNEETERKLVGGIHLHEAGGDTYEVERIPTLTLEQGDKEAGKVEAIITMTHNESQLEVRSLTPPSSAQTDFPGATQTSTESQNPPTSPPPKILFSLQTSSEAPPDSKLNLKAKEEVKSGTVSEDVTVKNVLVKPAEKRLQINTTVGAEEGGFISTLEAAKPEPDEAKFIIADLLAEETNPTQNSKKNTHTAKSVNLTRKPKATYPTVKPTTVKPTSPPKPQVRKPSAKRQLTTTRTATKTNKRSKSKKIKKEKKRRKKNKTQQPQDRRSKSSPPTHFPYFRDDYCPPECSCYGRVVQCSDKGIDQVPYGIPYNARYILLMNNHISSIQLDLLSEYVSMEFLVLSNNELTDGAIEGAFEGVPGLKRLYLDRNLLESVPVDLPVSLEELRLDNNHLRVVSEAAWERCPGLSVLSLSNNSLGNRSDSLPDGVLSALSNLRTLNLDHNKLASVPLGLPPSIKALYLRGNLIEMFRRGVFNGISRLMVLDLSANRLTNKGLLRDSLLNATHLESLNLEGNRLKQVPRHLPPSLKTLNLEGNLISSIKKSTFSNLKNMEHLGLARNMIFRVAPGAFRTLSVLHQLDLCHNALRQVPRHLPQGLHSVALSHNKIRSVPRDSFCWGNESLSGLVRVQLEHNLMDMGHLDTRAFRCLRGFQVVHFY